MPAFDEIEPSHHIEWRAWLRDFTEEQVRQCILKPDRIVKTNQKGDHGGLIRVFRKSFAGRTREVVAETHKNTCYLITAYWPDDNLRSR
jgi:Domain of unknown function (DUF4258)